MMLSFVIGGHSLLFGFGLRLFVNDSIRSYHNSSHKTLRGPGGLILTNDEELLKINSTILGIRSGPLKHVGS